ncbi:MAG: outer membrane protein assembly factor BamD [Phycisphaerales bacterium]
MRSAALRPALRLAFLALVAAAACSGVAAAQQEFKLDDRDQWKESDPADPNSPAATVQAAKLALAKGEPKRALALMETWCERYPTNPLRPEAILVRGDARLALGDEYGALFDYEEIARRYAWSAAFVPALEREFDIAKAYAAGLKRRFFGTFRIVNTDDDAQELLIRIQERLPGSALAEKAGMELADFYFKRRDMPLAADAYDLFVMNYPRSRQVDKARLRLIYAYYSGYRGPEFDAKGLSEASSKLRELQANEPQLAKQVGAEALLLRIYQSEAQKMLTTANWYWKVGDPISAERTIRSMVKKYPRSVATLQALRVIDQVLVELPESVRRTAPDYAALRTQLLASSAAEATAAPPVEERTIGEVKIERSIEAVPAPAAPAKDAPAAGTAPATPPAPAATPPTTPPAKDPAP